MVGSLSGRKARLQALPGLVALMGLLSGCAAVQSNVRGGFACGAPGGTCAPSTTIDDGALAAMHRAEHPQGKGRDRTEGADLVLGEDTTPQEDAMIVKTLPASGQQASADRSATPVGPALKIVYPAFQDRDGRAHPRRLAYALVDISAWAAALRGRGQIAASAHQPGVGEGLLGAALHAPPLGGLSREPDDSLVPANPPAVMVEGQGGGIATVSPMSPAGTPSASGKDTSPTARIEAEVSALLARRRAASAGTFSGKVE